MGINIQTTEEGVVPSVRVLLVACLLLVVSQGCMECIGGKVRAVHLQRRKAVEGLGDGLVGHILCIGQRLPLHKFRNH